MNIKHLIDCYPDYGKDNTFLNKAFAIIEYFILNPIDIHNKQFIKENYGCCQKHHIIPRCWFNYHQLPIDNTKENCIVLPILKHIEFHFYVMKYFESIKNKKMTTAMLSAVMQMLSKTIDDKTIRHLIEFDSFTDIQVDYDLLKNIWIETSEKKCKTI